MVYMMLSSASQSLLSHKSTLSKNCLFRYCLKFLSIICKLDFTNYYAATETPITQMAGYEAPRRSSWRYSDSMATAYDDTPLMNRSIVSADCAHCSASQTNVMRRLHSRENLVDEISQELSSAYYSFESCSVYNSEGETSDDSQTYMTLSDLSDISLSEQQRRRYSYLQSSSYIGHLPRYSSRKNSCIDTAHARCDPLPLVYNRLTFDEELDSVRRDDGMDYDVVNSDSYHYSNVINKSRTSGGVRRKCVNSAMTQKVTYNNTYFSCNSHISRTSSVEELPEVPPNSPRTTKVPRMPRDHTRSSICSSSSTTDSCDRMSRIQTNLRPPCIGQELPVQLIHKDTLTNTSPDYGDKLSKKISFSSDATSFMDKPLSWRRAVTDKRPQTFVHHLVKSRSKRRELVKKLKAVKTHIRSIGSSNTQIRTLALL